MEQYWREVVGSGERVLIELKSGSKEHSLLSDAVARMKSCWDGKGKGARGSDGVDGDGGTQQSSPNRAEVAHPPCSAESMKAIGKFALSVDDVSRLAYSCRLALSPDGVGVYKNPSKGLAAALELAANVLNSGLVPATLLAALPVYDPQKQTTGSPFFSRLWITSKKSKQSECAPQTGENVLEGAESATHDMRALLVDAILEVADYILAKESSEKLVFVLVAALQACCAPTVSRQSVTQMVDNRQTVARLSVHNDRLVKAFQLLCHIYVKPVILGDLATRAKTALKDVAKCLVTNMELERCESLGDSRVLGSSSPITTSVVSDFVHVMRFCSSIILCAPMVVAGGGGSQSMGSPNSCELGDPSSLGSLSNFLSKDALLVCSLGIMLHLTVNGGPVFRNSEAILECVRHVVIPAAIKGTVSCTIDVFRLSLSVLQTCYSQLGALLVNEVSTIFRHVYFRVLHSTLTTYSHKALVIEAFEKYIEEPRNMISLFINYDCDTRSQSIFEEMVHYLAAFAAPESLKKTLEVTSANSFSPSMTGTASGSKKTAEDLSNGSSLHGSFQAMALPPSFISVRLGYAIPESLRRKSLLALLSLVDSSIQWIDRFESSAVMIERVPPQHEETIEAAYDKGEHDDSEATEREPTHPSPTMFQRETFIQTKRYKDAFKKFLYIFNTKSSPRTALEYFQTNVDLQREFGSSSTCRSEGSSDHEANDGSNPVTAHATAVFLKAREEYIDKTILGEFFAKCFERAEWRTVLEEWVHLHDFRNLALDEAVRLFLGGFKLLGEAQVVDRTMELFAAEYCRQNPNVFSSADTAFILSFSICMLNTDAHSPHVKEKMTLDGFLRNNRSIDEGNDVDVDILSGIYTRITQKEIVLRPSPGCSNCGKGQWNQVPLTETHAPTGLLNSVPILRYLAPTATPRTATTESALLPESVENGFGPKRQKWEAAYQAELQKVLEEVTVALQQHLTTPPSEGDNPSPVVNASAANVECTLPMWEITVDVLRPILVASLAQFFCEAESFSPPSDGGASNSANKTITAACDLYLAENGNKDYFWRLLSGVDKVVRVCRTFGGADHVEILLEQLFQLSEVSQSVIIESSSRAGKVTVLKTMSRPRIDLLCTFLDLFMSYGDLLSSRGWHVGYTVVSLLDALANGMEGMFARQTRKYLEESNSSKSTTLSSARPDLWFGDLHDAPSCMSRESVERRRKILSGIRSSRSTMVDIWLERFFDATRYPASTRVRMTNGLAKVCHRELKNCRSFSTLKLFDFVTIGVNDFTRLQWRDVWLNASEVFITAGKAVAQLSHAALDGLRYVALMYIMREELLNYSFQKAVLMPFLEILESQSDTTIRRRVVEILSELIELRAEHLASGWGVVFRSLEAAARMPEVVSDAWAVTERIMTSHLGFIKDYFGDLIRCITAFSSSTDICVSQHAISYMVACGKWLRWGLLSPPPLGTAGDVLTWSRSTATLEEADIRKVPHVVVETVTIPDSSASKTGGSLWMALFDGLVPQTQLHGSLAVRAHATHAFFVLIQTHGDCFDGSVIDHLGQMIQRLLHSILDSIAEGEGAHRVSNPQVPAEEWCLLLCVALQSLLCSCVAVPQLTNSVVTAMESLCERCQTIFLIRHNVVDVMVRSCIDFIVATATDVYLTGDETCNRLLLMAVDNHRKHFGRFAAAADDPQWEELRSCNPACCIPEPIHFGENPDQISSVQKMVTRCLSDILLPQVFHWIQPGQVSHTCEANTQIVRSFCFVLLGVGVHAVATHEFDGCKGIVRIFEELQQECVALHEVMPEAQATRKSRMPIEALLIIPWMCCVMEYVGGLVQQSFPRWNEMAQVMTRRYMVFIRESQKWCAAEAPTVSFEDFFHTALSVDAPESLCSEPLTEANVRRYLQRSYLVHVIGLRWSWSCGETSLMARSADLQLFLNTIPALPSTMEERSLNPLYEHCCEVLCMPTELLDNSTETLLACVGFCDHKLNQGGRMSGGSSSIG